MATVTPLIFPNTFIKNYYLEKKIDIPENAFDSPQVLEKIEDCNFGGTNHSYIKVMYVDPSIGQTVFHVIRKYENETALDKQFDSLVLSQSEQWLDLGNGMRIEASKEIDPSTNPQFEISPIFRIFEGPSPFLLNALQKITPGEDMTKFKQAVLLFRKENVFHKIFVATPKPRKNYEHVELAIFIANQIVN